MKKAKPVFTNTCKHKDKNFVGSVLCATVPDGTNRYYDVYVFWTHQQGIKLSQHVCIRWGNEESEYYSPGELSQFIRTTAIIGDRMPPYKEAMNLILKSGRLKWKAYNEKV